MLALRTANLIIAFIATTAPIAHALEMISKAHAGRAAVARSSATSLSGLGEIFGPVEIVAFLLTLALLLLKRRDHSSRHAYLIAVACYAGMLADFFLFNRPVNEALSSWTPATLPAD